MHRLATIPGGWNPAAEGVIFVEQQPAPIAKSLFYCDDLTFSISATTSFSDRSSISAMVCTA
jgi:hypothetical protein